MAEPAVTEPAASEPAVTEPAVTEPAARTNNGALSLSDTGNARVNLFFKLNRDSHATLNFFQLIDNAWDEDILDTIKIIFNARDARGGKGDRKTFLFAMDHLFTHNYNIWMQLIKYVPEYGRYLDWVEMANMILEFGDIDKIDPIIIQIVDQLNNDHENMLNGRSVSLLAKWLPSEKKKWNRLSINKYICKRLFNIHEVYHWHYATLRKKYLTPLRTYIDIVEKYMCSNTWSEIDFSKVPSIAMHRLKKAFLKNSPLEFNSWKESLLRGETKVNFSQLEPHLLVMHYNNRYLADEIIEAQWKSIVEKTAGYGALNDCLVICDISGSMTGTPMDVAIALGILIASITEEPFRNSLITFSTKPVYHIIPNNCKTLLDKVKNVSKMHWEMTTDLNAVFKLILDRALAYELRENQMPKKLIILSDMQFDRATNPNKTNFEQIEASYREAGYRRPDIIFWNLSGSEINEFPVRYNQNGVALISGYRVDILKSIINGKEITPYNIMRETIDSSRYEKIKI